MNMDSKITIEGRAVKQTFDLISETRDIIAGIDGSPSRTAVFLRYFTESGEWVLDRWYEPTATRSEFWRLYEEIRDLSDAGELPGATGRPLIVQVGTSNPYLILPTSLLQEPDPEPDPEP